MYQMRTNHDLYALFQVELETRQLATTILTSSLEISTFLLGQAPSFSIALC
jgi:hypothetical protein